MARRERERKKPGPKREPRVKCDLCNEEELASHTTALEIVRSIKWEIKHPARNCHIPLLVGAVRV